MVAHVNQFMHTHRKSPPVLYFSGIDEKCNTMQLAELVHQGAKDDIMVAFGVLVNNHKAGTPRNPDFVKQMQFAAHLPCIAHLCDRNLFRLALNRPMFNAYYKNFLSKFDGVQLNINARQRDFSTEEVHEIYWRFLEQYQAGGGHIYLQYNTDTQDDIESFFIDFEAKEKKRGTLYTRHQAQLQYGLLLDGSRGLGVTPGDWNIELPECMRSLVRGNAGGLRPENVYDEYLKMGNSPLWLDAETGVRDENNDFSYKKASDYIAEFARAWKFQKEQQAQQAQP